MHRRVNLIWLGAPEGVPSWPLGEARAAELRPDAVAACLNPWVNDADATAWLFWDARLGAPQAALIERTLERPGDAWHAGLRLGMTGQPGLLDFVAPTWMLNADPAPDQEATSWRVSLGACLVRHEALRRLGGPRGEFRTLAGAALEMGHRWLRRGALVRHLPCLAAGAPAENLPAEDEVRFIYYQYGRFWARWAVARAVASGYLAPGEAWRAWWRATAVARPTEAPSLHAPGGEPAPPARVTVVIPTLDRYSHLRAVLAQLEQQTVRPLEVIVADQTPAARRETGLEREFADLPLCVMYLAAAGQCSSRNAAIEAARGELVLFLDDDVEAPDDLIEAHLASLERFGADASCGVAVEDGAGPLPEGFREIRASDVFPTGNSMVRRAALQRSGLFDRAYERGQRADGDLGMRLYRSGALLVLNPAISVVHHHAPRGGLRTHRARAVTYASSRRSLAARHLPSATEIYLARRYFTPRQVREMLWLRALGTLSAHGTRGRRALKALVGLVCLPLSGVAIARQYRRASEMIERFPQIPELA